MVKESIYVKGYGEIPILYDKENYKVNYIPNQKKLIIRRIKDNEILCVSANFRFVIQCEMDKESHFVIGTYTPTGKMKLSDYLLEEGLEFFYLKSEYEIHSSNIDDIRISDHTFIVNKSGNECQLYNLKDLSFRFDRIYEDKKIARDYNAILVEKDMHYKNLDEEIKYFLDLDTLKCVSPIHSELQDRYIPIYTQQKIEEIRDKLGDFITPNSSLLEITEFMEIKKYLILLKQYLSSPKIYNATAKEINEDYVRKFGLKK